MSEEKDLSSALTLMRRLPPASIENNLAGLLDLRPDLTEVLLNSVDQPLKTMKDPKTGQEFIMCDYNRDGDSFRSPWSNKYYPALDDAFYPSERLRQLEVEANKLFDVYRKLYFEGGHSSVYFFETDSDSKDGGYGATFLIHKDVDRAAAGAKGLEKGWWDSVHVFDVSEVEGSGKKNVLLQAYDLRHCINGLA